MKKERLCQWALIVTFFCATAVFTACTQDDNNDVVTPEYSTLKEALQDISLITMIKENPDTAAVTKKKMGELDYKEQYSMFFTQDLNHDDEGGDCFQQKVCILFRGFDRPTIFVTEGYDWDSFKDARDLGINLNANMVHVEHRNYGESFNQDKGHWEYQTVAQASADLHDIYKALKPIFKGKWMSTGTSKNGETSIGYAYYYPQDMSLASAFCSPFVLGLKDERFSHYLFEKAGTEEERNLMKTAIRKALQGGENGLYRTICEQLEAEHQRKPPFTEYVFNLFDSFFQVFQYTPQNNGRTQQLQLLATDDDVLIGQVCSVLEENRNEDYYSYWVECAKQMGWQNNGYDYFSDLLEGTSFNSDDVLPFQLKEEDRWLVGKYDGSTYTDIVNNFFMTTTCPILLFYVKDDPWSAGQPSRVGPNVKVVVNPIGRHASYLNDPKFCPEATKQEVMNYVSTYIY